MLMRFWRYLAWEFRWSLGVFTTLVLVGGGLLSAFYASNEETFDYVEACYQVFLLIFLQPQAHFPNEWYLRPLFFLLPIIGLGAVADSVVRLAYLVFAKKSNLPEWQRMVASLYRDHVIVLGLGKVGYRITRGLLDMREHVVAIERIGESPLIEEIMSRGVPLIRGDGRLAKTLEEAGVRHATAIILATSNDLANLDAALTARDLNPKIRVVLRLFDDTLADKFKDAFSMPAISTARVAAPAFIAAATGRKVYQEFELSGKPVHLTDLPVLPKGGLVGRNVGEIQTQYQVNIVMHSGPQGVNLNPSHEVTLAPNDSLLVIASLDRLLELDAINQSGGRASSAAASATIAGPPS